LVIDVVVFARENILGLQHFIGIRIGPILRAEELDIEKQNFVVTLLEHL
jgi:hypothetical protein